MNGIKRLGNIYLENEGGNFGGNAYDPSGLCPTIKFWVVETDNLSLLKNIL